MLVCSEGQAHHLSDNLARAARSDLLARFFNSFFLVRG